MFATFAIRVMSVVGVLVVAIVIPVMVAFIASFDKGVGSAAAVGSVAWVTVALATVRALWLFMRA